MLFFVVLGAIFLMSTDDLVSIFLSIELQSYGLYLLSTIYRNSELATTGGLIYFLLGGLSSCFILLGSALLYANSGTTNMDGLYIITSISDNIDSWYGVWYKPYYINISLLIFSVGFLFKVSAAPVERCRKSLLWVIKLSNSWDLLKLLILSKVRKYLSGWINTSGKVISQKMNVNEMEYRGSKSNKDDITLFEKEQRVYGSYYSSLQLRCTLTGCENSYQNKILFKQINRSVRLYSTGANMSTLPNWCKGEDLSWFWCGLIDGEGCFIISITKSNKNKVGWSVKLVFKIALHKKDESILRKLQEFFGVGNINSSGDCLQFRVESIKDLPIVISFFDEHLLITKKHADYLLFKLAVNLVLNKEHLTTEGLQKIDAIRGLMNRGQPSKLLQSALATSTFSVVRPLVPDLPITAPAWLAGFATAEGCFFINIHKSKSTKLGEAVQLRFILVQHICDEQLMKRIKDYFGCGNLLVKRETVHFTVTNFVDLTEKVIPFFSKYPVQGVKSKDFADWCKVADLMKNGKAHLTAEGLEQIGKIKDGMNKGRK